MSINLAVARAVAFPTHGAIGQLYAAPFLADAYAIGLPAGTATDAEVLARFIFSQQPAWIGVLMRVRDAIVARFGLKTGKQLASLGTGSGRARRIGIFKIYSSEAGEIVMGEDDKHLDFRVSVRYAAGSAAAPGGQLVVATVVNCHNLLGRAYILVIAPIHRLVVKADLRRAAQQGWPRAQVDGGNG